MKKLFTDEYTSDDVANLQTIAFIALIAFGIMCYISSSMGIYL